MSAITVGLVTDPIYKDHLTGPGHPECPGRVEAIYSTIKGLPLKPIKARDATEEDILRCHTKHYMQTVIKDVALCMKSKVHDGTYQLSTGDANISPLSLLAAVKSAGGVLSGIDGVIKGVVDRTFCLVRPPGHHAESDKGMGFCLFNNAAIGARYAQQFEGINRVAIIDWDVHHGNGTQEIFYNDPSVFYFSTHEAPLYPGTGEKDETGSGSAKGTTLNCPIKAGKNSRVKVIDAFKNELIPALDKFKPDLVIISAGFDAHSGDPLGSFNLTDDDYVELTNIVKEIANKYAKGRVISVLEGGYNLDAIASATKAHIIALMS